jgi:3-oxoacyl-[acyl-carrier protein] reductase
MDLELDGARALIGGATSGLGAATAERLADEGCRVVLWSRELDRLEASADALRGRGAEAATVAADASAPDAAAIVVERAGAAFGGIDIVVLNAGGPPAVDPLATTPDGWHDALQLLLLTPVAIATALLPGMRERGFGRIVAVLSSGIHEPIPNLVYSNAARAALAAWMKTVSRTVAADGVTVNGVVPGRIATPRTASIDASRARREQRSPKAVQADSVAGIPTGRYGEPAEFAAAVAFLCSRRASYQTGGLTAVDGGMLRSYL